MSIIFNHNYKPIYYKRLVKEINILNNFEYCENISFIYIGKNKTYLYFTYKKHDYRIYIPENYPFITPKLNIIFCKDDYDNYYMSYVDYFFKLFLFYKPFFIYECPCCFNIECNWTPKNTFVDLINDIDKYTNILQMLKEKYYCNKFINLNKDLVNIINDYL